jgi:hypothetical protein
VSHRASIIAILVVLGGVEKLPEETSRAVCHIELRSIEETYWLRIQLFDGQAKHEKMNWRFDDDSMGQAKHEMKNESALLRNPFEYLLPKVSFSF